MVLRTFCALAVSYLPVFPACVLAQIRASDAQGNVPTIAVKLNDKTRVGDDYQVQRAVYKCFS